MSSRTRKGETRGKQMRRRKERGAISQAKTTEANRRARCKRNTKNRDANRFRHEDFSTYDSAVARLNVDESSGRERTAEAQAERLARETLGRKCSRRDSELAWEALISGGVVT
ncbi:hypothetical protein BJV78DRAFT_1353640, partial [Lactifluus subvellereus]